MLSLMRLILIIPITYLILVDGHLGWLFGLIALAGLTDWLDGRVARWLGTISVWGKVLDPLADKIGAAMIVMALVARSGEPSLPVWFLALLVGRDLLILLGGVALARKTGHVAMSTFAGKLAVTMLALTMLAALLRADAPILSACVWVTSALLVYSFALYLVRFVRILRAGELYGLEEEDEDANEPPAPAAAQDRQEAGPVR